MLVHGSALVAVAVRGWWNIAGRVGGLSRLYDKISKLRARQLTRNELAASRATVVATTLLETLESGYWVQVRGTQPAAVKCSTNFLQLYPCQPAYPL